MANRRSCKRAFVELLDGNDDNSEKVYRFQILLPNGTSTHLTLHDPGEEMFVDEFVSHIKKEVEGTAKASQGSRRKILWDEDIYLEDMHDNKIKKKIYFNRFKTSKCHILTLHDGARDSADTFHNMWDLTPDTDLLAELPAEYTFETALADLIDNSLQAVWSNGPEEQRLISVTLDEHKIVIFDTGPGMDGSDENSISKWGKMGSSNHRISRRIAIGGNAPFLTPFFGMFGYGGPIASMHLGRHAIVSSKTKESKKVYSLHLSREALLSKSTSRSIWRTDGGIRDPLDEEIENSPHASFTKVQIHDLKFRCLETYRVQCLLKDVYFPYIQCDELQSRRTTMPIKFQVNNTDLTGIEGGEVAVTNFHSCNGPDFVLHLHFLVNQENPSSKSPGSRTSLNAHARLKCVYFPIVDGKENIDRILEKLDEDGYGIKENFDKFSRVSIRRLGRLLPDARWQTLPFMEPKQRKGDKAHLLRRCCLRVKCFVDTDAGFSPMRSKTDLAHHDPFTTALRNFGNKTSGKDSDATVEVRKDGKPLSLTQLEKEYQDWIIQMHDKYDEELECGEDEPVLVIGPCNKKRLGISAEVVRVHKVIRRRGLVWKAGQKVKILKGAVGCTKNNLYATLEFILLEGFQGDAGGEARLICRQLGHSEEKGCSLVVNDGNASLDIHDSLSFPISVIDTGKFQAIDDVTWKYQLEKKMEKSPSSIDVLTSKQCSLFEIDGELPIEFPVDAGYDPPHEIVAVIRPACFSTSSSSKCLDQKYIVKDDMEMSLEVKRMHDGKDKKCEFIFSERVKPSSRNGFHGLYIFSLRRKNANLFHAAGIYVFTFSVSAKDSSCMRREMKVTVLPASKVEKWRFIVHDNGKSEVVVRVGSHMSRLSVACLDPYSNQVPFLDLPDATIKLYKEDIILANLDKMKMVLSPNRLSLEIVDLLIESPKLDMIRPNFDVFLGIFSLNGVYSATIPLKVLPGPVSIVKMQSSAELEKHLRPGFVIEELSLEVFDAYGNHIEHGVQVPVEVDGFCFQDPMNSICMVNQRGYVNLDGQLKVMAGYGSKVRLSVSVGEKLIFEKIFHVAKRELRPISGVPKYCPAGSQLKNVVFGIFDSDGIIDEKIHGQHHTLTIKSEPSRMDDMIQYTFQHGRCTVPFISVPKEQGTFQFVASHTHIPRLHTNIKVCVIQIPKLELVTLTDQYGSGFESQFTHDMISTIQDSSQCTPSKIGFMVETIKNVVEQYYEEIDEAARRVTLHENKLKLLADDIEEIQNDLSDIQDSMELQFFSETYSLFSSKEQITKQIEAKGDTAAAVFCNLSKAIQLHELENNCMQDIVGLVALLGTVSDTKLSRIFAEYVGESYMLAIVCKSYKAASTLENYGMDGKVDRSCALLQAAANLGFTINRRYSVMCLEEIRPYKGRLINGHPQKKLALPNPLLPSGKIPAGFIGYAVNMIDIDIRNLNTVTSAGYGLRETLFYWLFGEALVYENRASMEQASYCIKRGALSLDGGIMRENGILLLGNCDPDIRFPVLASKVPRGISQQAINTLKQIEDKKALLEMKHEEVTAEQDARSKALVKYSKKKEKLHRFLGKEPLCNLLEYSPQQKPV